MQPINNYTDNVNCKYSLHAQPAPKPNPGKDDLVLQPTHVALNHRDLFLRQHLYPSPSFDTPMLSDACCTVLNSPDAGLAPGTRVVLNPGTGWVSDPLGPESPKGYAILGGTSLNPIGTAITTLAVHKDEAYPCPAHLSSEEAAALPLTGLTAWRAFATKSSATFPGANILVTGIGGGVACAVLQFAVAKGVRVWVTSSSGAKIEAAKKLGAEGGVNYKEKGWEKQLQKLLPKGRPYLDAVIDGAGGDLMAKATKLLKAGGVVSCYGMTVAPIMPMPMQAVLKNVELRGSTMGSRDEFAEMLAFVDKHKIRPVVSKVVHGKLGDMDKWEELFDEIKTGGQMGKLVFAIEGSDAGDWEEGRGYGRASGTKL